MKLNLTTPDGVHYAYIESIWAGKKTLIVNGIPAEKLNKREFKVGEETIIIKGSFITGVKLLLKDGHEIVLCKNKWYEWILIMLPFAYISLGVLGGGIGGGLSGGTAALVAAGNASIVRSKMNILLKVITCLLISTLGFFAWFLLYYLITGVIVGHGDGSPVLR